jgi:hypothetical protein
LKISAIDPAKKVIQKGIKPYFVIIIKEFKDYLFAFSPFFRKYLTMKKIKILGVFSGGFVSIYRLQFTEKEDPNLIKVGITSGPEQEIAEVAKKVAKENTTLK